MDLFTMFLQSALSVGFGKIIDILTQCDCDQKDKKSIGNVQANWIECSNCHKTIEQFTHACDFTFNKNSREIGHAIWGPADYSWQWETEGGFFEEKKSFLKIPFAIVAKGLKGRDIVVETKLSRYLDDTYITSHSSMLHVTFNNSIWGGHSHLFQDGNFKSEDKGIISVDISIMSEYKDILYENRRLIKPWK